MTEQKHYPMPELSEQELDSAMELAKFKLANGTASILDKIALAALTTSALGKVIADCYPANEERYVKLKPINTKGMSVGSSLVYTAPPVPAFKKIVTLPEVGFKAVITELNGKQIPAMRMVKGGNYLHRCRVRGILEDLGYEVNSET